MVNEARLGGESRALWAPPIIARSISIMACCIASVAASSVHLQTTSTEQSRTANATSLPPLGCLVLKLLQLASQQSRCHCLATGVLLFFSPESSCG